MASSHSTGDASVYTIDVNGTPASQLATYKNCTIAFSQDMADVRPLSRDNLSPQPVKRGCTISTSLMSVASTPVKVSNLDVTAFTAGGTDIFAKLRGGSFTANYNVSEDSGVGDLWKYPGIVSWGFTINSTFHVNALNASSASGVLMPLVAGTVANTRMVITVTINAVSVTLPCYLESASHVFNDGDLQVFEGTWQGSGIDSGTYPTAPTGSATILAAALNSPRTSLSVAFTSHATEGVAYAGEFLTTGLNFSWNDSSIITTDLTLSSQGTITAAAN